MGYTLVIIKTRFENHKRILHFAHLNMILNQEAVVAEWV
jgi:hypothetical protein